MVKSSPTAEPRKHEIHPAWHDRGLLLLVLTFALGLVGWAGWSRAARVRFVTHTPSWSVDAPTVAADSPTGYAGERRTLLVPGHNLEAYQWIAQTQQMLDAGTARIRHVDYENAPTGRAVHQSSPYRWWLGALAWCAHRVTGQPLGLAVEQAALWANPALHALLLIGSAWFIFSRFGLGPAVVGVLGLTCLFPLATGFAAAVPGHHVLILASAWWSLLLLAAGFGGTGGPPFSPRRSFALSGIAGGFGLWISVGTQLPLLLGIFAGGLALAFLQRRRAPHGPGLVVAPPPWRAWALGGATISVLGYLAEYFPGELPMEPAVNHPVYALSWLGAGELLARSGARLAGPSHRWTRREVVVFTLALPAIALTPAFMLWKEADVFSQETQLFPRLSVAVDVAARNWRAWITRDGAGPLAIATLAPVALTALGGLLLWRRSILPQASVVLLAGPTIIATAMGFAWLWWWNLAGLGALVLMVVLASAIPSAAATTRWIWRAIIAALFVFGATRLAPRIDARNQQSLTSAEGESFIERDLAHWLAMHAGHGRDVVVLAPPSLTTSLAYHGSLRGLGTLNWENHDGVNAAVRLASALSTEEAFALIESRGITHIVIPSWDSFLDQYAQLGSRGVADPAGMQRSFLASLHQWDLPSWLRPIPYTLPSARAGGPSVTILEVVDDQKPAVAMSRLAEYFVEMQRIDLATSVAQNLPRFPGDVSALMALTQVEAARGDQARASAAFAQLLPLLALDERRPLPFDQRVNLAILLAQFQQADLGRRELDRCLAGLSDNHLRSLTTVTLYRLQLLCKLNGRQISDPELRALAGSLLPPDLRGRL